jgi:ribosome recycling factor
MEEIQMYLDDVTEKMNSTVSHVATELAKIRAGKAMPNMLDGIKVSYYGTETPLNQVSSINSPDARTLIIKPFEKSIIQDIEKSIINSDLGLNPQNDGEQVIINVPSLTEERRKELVKHTKSEGEKGKISLRNARHETIGSIKNLKNEGVSEDNIKWGEEEIQLILNKNAKKIDELLVHKEKEIMTV